VNQTHRRVELAATVDQTMPAVSSAEAPLDEHALRAELASTDYDYRYGEDGARIRQTDRELLRDLMRRRWKTRGFTAQELEELERWRARRGH
jgi:hypothetical protein